jgi:maltose O-acetyltransferase
LKGTIYRLIHRLPERYRDQLWLVFVQDTINLVSNILGEDYLSMIVRRGLLRLYGARFGPGTLHIGKSFFGGARLVTGSGCYIGRGCFLDFSAPITLGSNVVVGHGVTFITAKHQIGEATQRAGAMRGASIVVGDGAWVGANATILPGVSVGRGAVVAAGAVVSRDVPPNVIVAGVPAKIKIELS